MSGLYDGLYDDIAKKNEEKSASASPPLPAPVAAKPVPAHLLLARKRAAASAPLAAAAPAKKMAEHAVPAPAPAPPAPVAATILDPYDPAEPNVYERLRGVRDDADAKRLRRPPPPTFGKELLRQAGGWPDGQRLGKRGTGGSVMREGEELTLPCRNCAPD
jgi:hypothetical protein